MYKRIFVLIMLSTTSLPSVSAEKQLTLSQIKSSNHNVVLCRNIAKVALERLNIQLKIVVLPASRALLLSNNGTTDGDIARTRAIEKSSPHLRRVPISCAQEYYHGYTTKGNEFDFSGWLSVPKQYIIGYRGGVILVEKEVMKLGLKSVRFNSLQQELKMLAARRIDFMVESPSYVDKIRKEQGLVNVVMLQPAFKQFSFYIYLHEKHENLRVLLTSVMVEMKISGEMERIRLEVLAN